MRHRSEVIIHGCFDDDLAKHLNELGVESGGAWPGRGEGGPLAFLDTATQTAALRLVEVGVGFNARQLHLIAHTGDGGCGGYKLFAGIDLLSRSEETTIATLYRDGDVAGQIAQDHVRRLHKPLEVVVKVVRLQMKGNMPIVQEVPRPSSLDLAVPFDEYECRLDPLCR